MQLIIHHYGTDQTGAMKHAFTLTTSGWWACKVKHQPGIGWMVIISAFKPTGAQA